MHKLNRKASVLSTREHQEPKGVMIHNLKPYPAMKDSGVPWLGKVPMHWAIERLKSSMNNVIQQTGERQGSDLYVALEHVESWTGRLRQVRSDVLFNSQVKRFRSGDILFGKLRPYLAKVTRPMSDGVCVGEFLVLRPRFSNATAPYIEQLLISKPIIDTINSSTFGAKMPRADWQFVGGMAITLPPLPEQSTIVRFLNHVDRRIRHYIRAKQKLIKLLEEQKQAIIHRSVTRGLDPKVRLRPSGVEWIGDIPEHWEVRKLGQIAVSFHTGPFGSILHQSDYVEGGIPVINPTHMSCGRIIEDTRCSVPPTVADRLMNYRLEQHDLIFSRRGELGRCALVRDREAGWLCGTGSIRVRVAYADIEPEYLIQSLQVRWIGEYLSLFSVGATMDSLNTGILKGVPVLVPPINEQRALLSWIANEGRRIDIASAGAEREISLLLEYRTRLIADVVTGKLDVREVAARLPDETEEPEPIDEAAALSDTEEEAAVMEELDE